MRKFHAHLIDVNETKPIDEVTLGIDKTRRMVECIAVTPEMPAANEMLRGLLDYRGLEPTGDYFGCEVPLERGLLMKNAERLVKVAALAEQARERLNQGIEDPRKLWNYSMAINGDGRARVGMHNRGRGGICEILGIVVNRVDGGFSDELRAARAEWKTVVREVMMARS